MSVAVRRHAAPTSTDLWDRFQHLIGEPRWRVVLHHPGDIGPVVEAWDLHTEDEALAEAATVMPAAGAGLDGLQVEVRLGSFVASRSGGLDDLDWQPASAPWHLGRPHLDGTRIEWERQLSDTSDTSDTQLGLFEEMS